MGRFVTTRAEYQWDGDRYVLIDREGYEYDGPWAMADFSVDQGDAPPPPDTQAIIREQAQANRINQNTPFGSLSFSGPNNNTANLEFTPEIMDLLGMQLGSDRELLTQALARQRDLPQSPIDLEAFGPIQSNIDPSGINFSGVNFNGLPGLNAPNLQTSVGSEPVQRALDVGGLLALPDDIQSYRSDAEGAFFNRGKGLLDESFSDRQRELDQRLANQGLPRSGEAVDRDQTRFLREQNRAYGDLANNAVLFGGQEASRQLGDILATRGQGFGEAVTGGQFANTAANQAFNQALSQGGFANQAGLLGLGADQGIRGQLTQEQLASNQAGNQAAQQQLGLQQLLLQNQNAGRTQALSEAQGIRGNQFNELASLLGLQQVQQPGLQNFFAPGSVDVTGAYGLNQAGQLAAFNAENQQNNALMSGLFGLGGAVLGGPVGGALLGNVFPNIFGNA